MQKQDDKYQHTVKQVLADTNGPRDALRHTQSSSCCPKSWTMSVIDRRGDGRQSTTDNTWRRSTCRREIILNLKSLCSPTMKIWKATQNVNIEVVWGQGLPQVTAISPFDWSHITSYLTLIKTMHLSCTVFALLRVICQKSPILTHNTWIWPQLGVIPFKFRWDLDLWHQNITVLWAIVWRCLRDPKFSRFYTILASGGRTDTRRRLIPRYSIASRGKNDQANDIRNTADCIWHTRTYGQQEDRTKQWTIQPPAPLEQRARLVLTPTV